MTARSARSSRAALATAIALLVLIPSLGVAQKPIPIRQLGPIEATSTDSVGFLYGVRELPGRRLLANDAGARRLVLFDASLARVKIAADSMSGSPSPYGKRPTGIIAYRGDTTLLVDAAARAFVMIDAKGDVVGVMSPPRANDVQSMVNPGFGAPGLDARGRLIYRGQIAMTMKPPAAGTAFTPPEIPDTVPIVRADFDTRAADTLGWLRVPKIRVATTTLENGALSMRAMLNPVSFIDDWAMLPDGSVAILRGRDYHIDWINADGSRVSSPKMPFDWKHLTDEDKAALIDSTKKAVAAAFAGGGGAAAAGTRVDLGMSGHSMTVMKVDASDGGPAPRSSHSATPEVANSPPDIVPPGDLPDYMPPVLRSGTMMADPAGRVWILPSTSAHAAGGLLYDVIDRKGEIVQRVRIPAGRALVGFGADGAVYLTRRDASGTHIERARIE
ncbi:MAG: hypothetical protein ABJD07_05520 [Gemmatimonadaceae bacterium]